MSTLVAAADAFRAQIDDLRSHHGAGTLVVKPQVYQLPDLSELATGGWAFLDGEPALIPAMLEVLVLTDGNQVNDKGVKLEDALQVLERFKESHAEPVPYHAVTVPEEDKARVLTVLRALPSAEARPPRPAPSPAGKDAINDDIASAESPFIVKLAAAFQAFAGLLVGLSGLQVVTARWANELLSFSPYLLMGLGAASVFVAGNQFRGKAWAGPGSIALTSVTALTTLGWVIMMFTTVMSCMAYCAVPLTLLAALLSLVAFPAMRKTAAARKRLADQGLSLGL
ncbi:MAG: hypothetical protein AB8I08_19685 [Sandaracinaceae bacterium]